MSRLPTFVNVHIATAVTSMASYGTLLPGGLHRAVGPEGIAYPHAVMTYITGSDSMALNSSGSQESGGLLYQLKVIDLGEDETKAAQAYEAICAALKAANHSGSSGAYVAGREESPVDLPVVERDQLFQQFGGTWRFWVDPI